MMAGELVNEQEDSMYCFTIQHSAEPSLKRGVPKYIDALRMGNAARFLQHTCNDPALAAVYVLGDKRFQNQKPTTRYLERSSSDPKPETPNPKR